MEYIGEQGAGLLLVTPFSLYHGRLSPDKPNTSSVIYILLIVIL